MRIQASHPTQPRRVYPESGALKLRDAELYFDSVIIGEAVTPQDLEQMLIEADMPEYNGVLVEQEALARSIIAALENKSPEETTIEIPGLEKPLLVPEGLIKDPEKESGTEETKSSGSGENEPQEGSGSHVV